VGTLANYASLEFEQNNPTAAQDLYFRYVNTTLKVRASLNVFAFVISLVYRHKGFHVCQVVPEPLRTCTCMCMCLCFCMCLCVCVSVCLEIRRCLREDPNNFASLMGLALLFKVNLIGLRQS